MKPFQNAAVTEVFQAYPAKVCPKILALRELIFSTPASTEVVGEIEEAREHDPHRMEKVQPIAIRDVLPLPDESR